VLVSNVLEDFSERSSKPVQALEEKERESMLTWDRFWKKKLLRHPQGPGREYELHLPRKTTGSTRACGRTSGRTTRCSTTTGARG